MFPPSAWIVVVPLARSLDLAIFGYGIGTGPGDGVLQTSGATKSDEETNASRVRRHANPNSSARYGSPFRSQNTSVTCAPGGSPARPIRNALVSPSPVQTVGVLIRFRSNAEPT